MEQFFEVLLANSQRTDQGLRLPTERELAEITGLSRASVREHLAALRVMGLLTKTQGSANVLHQPTEESSGAIYKILLQMRHASLGDVAEAREMFEIGMIPFVCRRIGPGDLERLRSHVDQMIRHSSMGDTHGAVDADMAFHRILFETLNNPITDFAFAGLRTSLRDLLLHRREQAITAETAKNGGTPPAIFCTDSVHMAVVDALTQRDEAAAVTAMTHHYEQFRQLVLDA